MPSDEITVQEASDLTGLHNRTIYTMAQNQKIWHRNEGKHVMVKKSEILQVAQHRKGIASVQVIDQPSESPVTDTRIVRITKRMAQIQTAIDSLNARVERLQQEIKTIQDDIEYQQFEYEELNKVLEKMKELEQLLESMDL